MTHTDYTRNILNIKDENISFEENCLEFVKINEITTKVFHGKLTYTPNVCPNCGCLYESNPETIIKYGFKKIVKLRLTKPVVTILSFYWINKDFIVNTVIQLLLLLLIMLIFINKFLMTLKHLLL